MAVAAAEQAAETARRTFEEGTLDENLPTVELPREKVDGAAVTTLAQLAGLTSSASEARRHIEGGGLRLNDQPVSDVRAKVSAADFAAKGVIKLSVGRKKHILVKPV